MIRSNNFNGGPSSGATITTGNSGGTSGNAFSYVNGSVTYSNSQAGGNRGSLVCSMPASTGANVGWDGWSLAARTFYWRLYAYVATAPNSERDFSFTWAGDMSNPAYLGINASRQIYLQGPGGATQLTTTSALTLNQWVRVEARVAVGTTTSNGTCEIRLFNDADSFTATDAPSGTGKNFGTSLPIEGLFIGNSQYSTLLDALVITDEDWPGPDVGGIATRRIIANSLAAVRRASYY